MRWKSIPHLSEVFGGRTLPFLELGYLIVALTLVQITLVAIVLIILPLFKIGWRGGKKGWIVLYFSGIGLGFMFVEIVLIQRFTLYFGNPIYAASAVISTMMIFSGIGSYFSSRLTTTAKTILMITTAIIFLLLLYALVLTPILQQSIALPLPIKILLAILLIAIPTTMMGNLFPLGLRIVSHHNQQAIPWAWGINGCLSVISSVLATLIAVEMGFYWVMIFAALAYGLPLVVNLGGGGTN
ncbi:hypothetical protein GWN26_14645 [Candidatus Saccharibacteria bacterium]|nr:hypothetical protein [Candidatus Saccharibacteria bacterium]NIW80640.1 hypothetical protein [Calditrichia bacterium]